ncbi:MAG TPA: ATP-binding protein [Steroidobacteraceae bacterium]|nr:ATP-binding protein [Steroidobacteraceae bacterium]
MVSDTRSERVLIVAPVGRDAAAIADLLSANGYCAHVCSGASEAAAQAGADTAALLLTEEALVPEQVPALLNQLGAQPAWSELPVIILTSGGESRSARLLDLTAAAAGSVTLLERPLAAATLLRTIEVALRSRRRQYQVRALLEAQLARETALQAADRRKDTFLAILSHELRNPLAPIRNAAELLGSAQLTPTQLRWAQSVIRRQTGHMAALLDDLLDLARITQGKLRLHKDPCSLRSVIEAAVETARPLLEKKAHHLSVRLPDEVPVLLVDGVRLAQAVGNLLTNAAKYTDGGGSIDLEARLENELVITVTDNGIGIPADQLGGLFTMFSQVSSGNRSEGGLGIGLALVKGVVELHGGQVEARSAGSGKGSEFSIRLPVTSPPTDPESTEVQAQPDRLGKLRVLIADDNKDAADSLALLLSHDGHEVRTAYGGHAAVSVVETFRPEVAFLDIGMPELDGFAVANAIRQRRAGAEVCLIAVTGWGQEEDKRRAREAGFAMHLTKPVDPDRVRTALVRLQNGEVLDRGSAVHRVD